MMGMHQSLPYNPYTTPPTYSNNNPYASNDENNTTVFIGGLPSEVGLAELKTYAPLTFTSHFRFFLPFGEIASVKIPPGKGCGFVQFVHRESAESAIVNMSGYSLGKKLVQSLF